MQKRKKLSKGNNRNNKIIKKSKKQIDYLDICSKCPKNIHCCRFKDMKGYVFVGIKDAENIKKATNLPYHKFLNWKKLPKWAPHFLKDEPEWNEGFIRFRELLDNHLLMLKIKKDGDCIFLKEGKCTIYKIRPNICRIYPYWFYNGDKLHIIAHGEDCKCKALKQKEGLATLKEKELKPLRKVAKGIIKEYFYYKENIIRFIEENKFK